MARGKRFDKKTATTFQVVHRPQNDPRIHDESAPQVLLNQTSGPGTVKHLDDLASELGSAAGDIRPNEGEAATYGIYFDDTDYDYMQHLREPGLGGTTVFVPATTTQDKAKGRKKQEPLEEQLQKLDLENSTSTRAMVDPDMLPTPNLPKLSYQAQQDVPDYIAGFQPGMDPRLREVLAALEDDAYVGEDDDIFKELARDGEQVTERDFEDAYFEWSDGGISDDDGYESDRTVKPAEAEDERWDGDSTKEPPVAAAEGAAVPANDWMEQFNKFKRDQQPGRKPPAARSELQSSILSTSTMGGRRKKRKGALTSTSTYSMTSSSLVRTEQLTILDARFDKIEEAYNEEDDGDDDMSSISGLSAVSTASSITGPMREDFDSILDEFLGEKKETLQPQPRKGKGRKKKGMDSQIALAQLDEIRRGLGPAHIRSHA